MLDPSSPADAELPHPDLPADCAQDYQEARAVASISPRAAAALLRLCVQKLCIAVGQPGKNINDDIGALVKTGLPVRVQQALDILRVTGNNAVHPGSMSGDDHAEQVGALFEMLNLIVDILIAQPKRIAERFDSLPSGALAGIRKRDGTT